MSGIPPGEAEHALSIVRRSRPDGQPHARDCGYLNPDHDGPCEPDKVEDNSRYLIDLTQHHGGIPLDMIEPDGPVPQQTAMDVENSVEIVRHRERLSGAVSDAYKALREAWLAAEALTSDQVYDVEMAEGETGATIVALLTRLRVDTAALRILVDQVGR